MLRLAQAFLLVGGASLVIASLRLFLRAFDGGMPAWHLAWILPLAVVVGGGKGFFVIRRRMVQNVRRLTGNTDRRWPWQIYPWWMLFFISMMILAMVLAKRVLADNALGLGILGGVDAAVALAIAIGSTAYREALRNGVPAAAPQDAWS